jgi:lincosamide nucleotidyltransferase
MLLQDYRSFIDRLLESLTPDPRVLGLIAVGSMAQRDTRPDDWSDHDFLVVVAPGAQEEFRARADWLPDHERLVLRFRETAHGLKALYEHGHMIEFAVFDPEELHLGKFNRFRVLLDRADLQRRMEQIVAETTAWSRSSAPDDAYAIGQVVTGVLVAYGRWVRGERLSARSFLVGQAVPQLVRLLARYVPAERPDLLDNLDPLRRFELVYESLGAALDEVLDRPLPAAAAGLLDLAERELSARLPRFPAAAVAAVRRRMA